MTINVYSTACTPWFIAAQQAVPAGGAPVNLLGGALKVGDGNGAVPTISQIINNGGVVHQVWAGAPNSVAVDAANTGQIDVGCLIPTVDASGNEIGPFNVTEFAIYDATGNLAIVGTTNLQKTTSANGQLMTLQWFACYIASAANAVTVQPPAGSFPTLGQVQSGVAGLLSANAPLSVTPSLQPSGWTSWLLNIASATLTALGIGRPATNAEFAAGASATGFAWPWPTLQQIFAAFAAIPKIFGANTRAISVAATVGAATDIGCSLWFNGGAAQTYVMPAGAGLAIGSTVDFTFTTGSVLTLSTSDGFEFDNGLGWSATYTLQLPENALVVWTGDCWKILTSGRSATAAEFAAGAPAPGGYAWPWPTLQQVATLGIYVVDTGVANAIVATVPAVVVATTPGVEIRVKVAAGNSGSATFNGSALHDANGYPLPAGYYQAGNILTLTADGACWRITAGSFLNAPQVSYSNITQLFTENYASVNLLPAAAGTIANIGAMASGVFTFTRPGLYSINLTATGAIATSGAAACNVNAWLYHNASIVINSSENQDVYTPIANTFTMYTESSVIINAAAGDTISCFGQLWAATNYLGSSFTEETISIQPLN